MDKRSTTEKFGVPDCAQSVPAVHHTSPSTIKFASFRSMYASISDTRRILSETRYSSSSAAAVPRISSECSDRAFSNDSTISFSESKIAPTSRRRRARSSSSVWLRLFTVLTKSVSRVLARREAISSSMVCLKNFACESICSKTSVGSWMDTAVMPSRAGAAATPSIDSWSLCDISAFKLRLFADALSSSLVLRAGCSRRPKGGIVETGLRSLMAT